MESFSLQQYIVEMRAEQRQDHQTLLTAIKELDAKVASHETRLVVVENTRKSVLGLSGAMVLAFLGAFIDMLFNHVWKR